MKRAAFTLPLALFLAAATSSAGGSDGARAFFPLTDGQRWVYEARNSGYRETGSITVAAVRHRAVAGALAPTHRITISKSESYRFYGSDDEGIFSHAYQGPGDSKPIPEESRRYLMKYPLRAGTSWTRSYGDKLSRSRVEDMNVSITVPAGTFRDCMTVREVITPVDGRSRFPRREILTSYAPGVGLVRKISRLEVLQPGGDKTEIVSISGEKNLVSFR